MPDSLTRTLVALTFVTGIVDAVTFLALGQVFSAMQTGNVIFLGFGIAGATSSSVLAPLIGLASFLAGSGVAALLARAGVTRPFVLAMLAEVGLLGAAAVVAGVVDVTPGEGAAYALIATLSLAMGLRNTTARVAGDQNLVTTVLNLTLTAVTTHAPMRTAPSTDLAERSMGIAAILLGALTGALLLKTSLALAIAAAAVITMLAYVERRRGLAAAV